MFCYCGAVVCLFVSFVVQEVLVFGIAREVRQSYCLFILKLNMFLFLFFYVCSLFIVDIVLINIFYSCFFTKLRAKYVGTYFDENFSFLWNYISTCDTRGRPMSSNDRNDYHVTFTLVFALIG